MSKSRICLGAMMLVIATAAATNQVVSQTGGGEDPWLKYSVPDENHEVLDRLIGTWSQQATLWKEPGAEPASAEATAEYRWILGGRFVVGEWVAYEPGRVFHAKDIVGYDRFRGQYNSLWVDNTSTAFTTASGRYDKRENTLILEGVQDEVERNARDQPFRMVYRFTGPDAMTIEVYRTAVSGKLFKSAEVHATRAE
jgi:hypothetical protein